MASSSFFAPHPMTTMFPMAWPRRDDESESCSDYDFRVDSWADDDDDSSDDDGSWYNSYVESMHALAGDMRRHSLSRCLVPIRLGSYSFPRFWAEVEMEVACRRWRRPDPVSRHIPRTPYSEAKRLQLQFSSSAVVLPPSNTPLTRNITKAFERAPGIWPP